MVMAMGCLCGSPTPSTLMRTNVWFGGQSRATLGTAPEQTRGTRVLVGGTGVSVGVGGSRAARERGLECARTLSLGSLEWPHFQCFEASDRVAPGIET
jgi:hypothetical protein